MNRDEKLIVARNHYIIEIVNSSPSVTQAVMELSQRLYITERRIYQILKATETTVTKIDNCKHRL